MYRGHSQETTPTLFTADAEGYPAEGLPRTGRPPKEAAFRLRFGLALLVSIGLHVMLGLLVPGRPPNTVAPAIPATAVLSVSLTNPAAPPTQPEARADRPQAAGQAPTQRIPAEPQPPVVQTEPQPNQVSITHQDPVPATIVSDPPISPTTTATTTGPAAMTGPTTAAEPAPISPGSQKPILGPGTQAPPAAVPDALQIGEEFKLAFMKRLAYPETARRRGVQGTVGLRIVMDADGRIAGAQVSQTSGSSILDRAAVSAALSTPGPLGGPGRRLELVIRVSFEAGRVLARP